MSDLIDRKMAIDVIDKIFPADPMRNEYTQGITCGAALAMEYIKQLPSAEPYTDQEILTMQELEQAQIQKAFELGREDAEPKWIPVTERLPEEDEDVLVSTKDGIVFDAWLKSKEPLSWGSDSCDVWEYEVTAWMPLPECYRGESDGE